MSQFEFSRNKSLSQNLYANAYWVYNTKEARVKEKREKWEREKVESRWHATELATLINKLINTDDCLIALALPRLAG